MKSLLACVLAGLLAIDASSLLAASKPKSRAPAKDAPAKVILFNFSNEEAVPDPSDAIAASREWKDATGEHSCQAQLQSVQAGDVTLKKKDDTVSIIPLPKLCKDDQELVRAFLMRNTLRQIKKAVQAYRQADLGDANAKGDPKAKSDPAKGETSAKLDEKRKSEEDKLRRKINGRSIRLVFPIKDVTTPEKGFSTLTLEAPDGKDDEWDYRTNAKMKFTKEEALRAGSSSVLIVEGKAVVSRIGAGTSGQKSGRGLDNDSAVLSYDDVQLTLDKGMRMTVQHGHAKVENAAKSDAPSATADHGATAKPAATSKPDAVPAATVSDAIDAFDSEKSVPESADDIAASRKWRDANGEHSVTAELQSVEAGSVALKKGDGTVKNVPFTKLYKDDQELVRSFLVLSSKRKVAAAVESFFKTLAESDAHVAMNEKVAADKLYKTVNGRELRLVFPIKNVAPPQDEKGSKLDLGDPDFPKGSLTWHCQTSAFRNLSKEESTKIGQSSVLVVQGKVRVELISRQERRPNQARRGRRLDNAGGKSQVGNQDSAPAQKAGSGQENDSLLSWESPGVLPGGGQVSRKILLYLDNAKMTVQNEQQKAKTAN